MAAPTPQGQTLAYSDTLLGATTRPAAGAVDATALAVTQVAGAAAPGAIPRPAAASRTTVLPRIEGEGPGSVAFHLEAKNRYEPIKLLGKGGMGEVVLVEDQDIARKVAVKRLLPELEHPALLARFVDEIRTVGRLEHPNIVPIHDVGVDELGRYFFVMKYVEGETLETVIEKLAAGDPDYHARYTFERRVEIFVALLRALEYAHDRGIVHRDIKPANVMIGRFGEVLLMDWGIAKPLDAPRDIAATLEGAAVDDGQNKSRAFATRIGSIIGTPAYMAPEQARGESHKVDARSDLYSACVLFHELVGLRHYLADSPTVDAMLASVRDKEQTFWELWSARNPEFGAPPAELMHVAHEGMFHDASRRYGSAAAIIDRLQIIREGRIPVQCPFTFTKRVSRETSRFVDRFPVISAGLLFCLFGAILLALVIVVRGALLHA
ncbi:MAG: serine/threonine-protein kinase [Byssovorax sp.]